MKILVIGGSGREHALAWKLAQSPLASQIFVAPGNAGTQLEANIVNVPIDTKDIDGLIKFAKSERITFTVVGPEAPLALGIVDFFQSHGLTCFGPSKNAARIEASKAFAKEFMQKNGIPTAEYLKFTEAHAAKDYTRKKGFPIVIKADGLAAGKGVVIAHNKIEAFTAIDKFIGTQKHQHQAIVIEEFLTGEEASFIVVADGLDAKILASSQDHKARDDGGLGPNTGGMGAYSPAPIVTPELEQKIMETVIKPTLEGMAANEHPYQGFLYAGLMINPNNEFKVLEFNCRLGDPEAEVILLRLKGDLVELCQAVMNHSLKNFTMEWDSQYAIGVVLASAGYPGSYEKGHPITGIENLDSDNVKVFHAGTRVKGDTVVTNGGRVLCVNALGDTIQQAQETVYAALKQISWNGIFYRKDIAYHALQREQKTASNQ